jgi:hypothetical protein
VMATGASDGAARCSTVKVIPTPNVSMGIASFRSFSSSPNVTL